MTSYGDIDMGNIGSANSNGLLPDGTKPLPESIVTNHHIKGVLRHSHIEQF